MKWGQVGDESRLGWEFCVGGKVAHNPGSDQPDAGFRSRASSVKSCSDWAVHARVLTAGSWKEGPHRAPATAEVVRCGGSVAHTRTELPASARQIAVVNPLTPAPITITSDPCIASPYQSARGD